MRWVFPVVLVLFCSFIRAETPEQQRFREASERLRAKQSTTAATQDSESVRLRAIIADLQKQVADLKEQNELLKQQLLKTPSPDLPKHDAGFFGSPDVADEINKGMNTIDVRRIIGRKPQNERSTDNLLIQEWIFVKAAPIKAREADPARDMPTGDASDPRNVGIPNGSVKVTYENGKVVNVEKEKF